MTKKNILISFTIALISGISMYLVSSAVYRVILNSIGCDCGPGVEVQGGVTVNSCGCAAQAEFSNTAAPIVSIAPFVAFAVAYVISFIVLKSKKK